ASRPERLVIRDFVPIPLVDGSMIIPALGIRLRPTVVASTRVLEIIDVREYGAIWELKEIDPFKIGGLLVDDIQTIGRSIRSALMPVPEQRLREGFSFGIKVGLRSPDPSLADKIWPQHKKIRVNPLVPPLGRWEIAEPEKTGPSPQEEYDAIVSEFRAALQEAPCEITGAMMSDTKRKLDLLEMEAGQPLGRVSFVKDQVAACSIFKSASKYKMSFAADLGAEIRYDLPLERWIDAARVHGSNQIVHGEYGTLLGYYLMGRWGERRESVRIMLPFYVRTYGQECTAIRVATRIVDDQLGFQQEQTSPWPQDLAASLARLEGDGACENAVHFLRDTLPDGSQQKYYLRGHIATRDKFEAAVKQAVAAATESKPAMNYLLPDELYGRLNEPFLWQYIFAGDFSLEPQQGEAYSSRFAYLTLLEAYSNRVQDSGGSCRILGDIGGTVTQTLNDKTSGLKVIYYPENHRGSINRLEEGSSVNRQPLYRHYLEDAEAITAYFRCADGRFAILRENAFRWVTRQPATDENERRSLLATTMAAPSAPKTKQYPVLSNQWRPFVESCLAWHAKTRPPTDSIVQGCICKEYVTQVTGDRSLYDLFVSDYLAAEQTSTRKPKPWIEMWNNVCHGKKEKLPDIVKEHITQF
ncbi:MAG: hypothetical protein KDK08_03710, partial [Rhizobiaceae bacterium]|nr:hypothetical protein [Rhizobiaceae bacterium]